MIEHMNKKCGVLSDLKLANYGNFCGYGGEGVPIDELDQCCCMHDKCYGDIMAGVCDGKVSEAHLLFHLKGSKTFRNGRLLMLIFFYR